MGIRGHCTGLVEAGPEEHLEVSWFVFLSKNAKRVLTAMLPTASTMEHGQGDRLTTSQMQRNRLVGLQPTKPRYYNNESEYLTFEYLVAFSTAFFAFIHQ